MFFGSFLHTLDDKNRLVIPRKMREEAGVKVFVLKGFDGALSVYKASTFEKMCKDIVSLPFNKKETRAYQRIQLANACELDIDKAGRIQIPTQLINKYQISKEVVVVGVIDHIEIWNKDVYQKYEKDNEANFEEIAEHLASDEK